MLTYSAVWQAVASAVVSVRSQSGLQTLALVYSQLHSQAVPLSLIMETHLLDGMINLKRVDTAASSVPALRSCHWQRTNSGPSLTQSQPCPLPFSVRRTLQCKEGLKQVGSIGLHLDSDCALRAVLPRPPLAVVFVHSCKGPALARDPSCILLPTDSPRFMQVQLMRCRGFFCKMI